MYSERILWWAIFKKVFFFLTISIFFSTTVYASINSSFWEDSIINGIQGSVSKEEKVFITSWYYSALPDQKEYVTGSYEWDIKLNGRWVHGASGTWVFAWMLAAPKSYPFGTKIYLEDYWVGAVEDRGGAIVEASEWGYDYDRIDIWMGYGDEWRLRAKNWGKRKVKWIIVSKSEKVTIRLKSSLEDLYLYLTVSPDSWEDDIRNLQLFFQEIGKYKGKINGNYEDIKDIIIAYQYEKGLIKNKDDRWAGHFWPKTVKKLKEDLWVSLGKEVFLTKAEKENLMILRTNVWKNIKAKKYKIIEEKKIVNDLVKKLDTVKEKSKDKKLKMKIDYLQSII